MKDWKQMRIKGTLAGLAPRQRPYDGEEEAHTHPRPRKGDPTPWIFANTRRKRPATLEVCSHVWLADRRSIVWSIGCGTPAGPPHSNLSLSTSNCVLMKHLTDHSAGSLSNVHINSVVTLSLRSALVSTWERCILHHARISQSRLPGV